MISIKLNVSDAHCHASPLGLGSEQIAKKFKEAGGWFIAIVSLPPHAYGLDLTREDIMKSLEYHVKECKKARDADIKVSCIAGVHPATVDRLLKLTNLNIEKVLSVMNEVLRRLKRMKEDDEIDGFGEFGRPHYRTLPEAFVVNELMMFKVFEIMADVGGFVHLHLEQAGEATVATIDNLARNFSIKKEQIILHHASIKVAESAAKLGYPVTITGKKEAFVEAINKGIKDNLMIESDYIDDPRRPGVVMYPWEIRDEIQEALESGLISVDDVAKIMVDNVTKYMSNY